MYIYDVDHSLQCHTGNLKSLSPGKHCVKYEYPPPKRKRSWNLKQNRLYLFICITLTFDSKFILSIMVQNKKHLYHRIQEEFVLFGVNRF